MTSEELKFFDDIAPKWDSMEINSTPEKVAELIDFTGIKEGYEILDLGTGTGVLIPELSARTGSSGIVVAVDLSEGMLSEARKKHSHLNNVRFLKMDFEKSEVPGRYDLIMLYCVYPHLLSPIETLTRLKSRNLKDGGKIIIGFPKDERYINGIHADRKVESDLLPSASELAARLILSGLESRVLVYGSEGYLIEIS